MSRQYNRGNRGNPSSINITGNVPDPRLADVQNTRLLTETSDGEDIGDHHDHGKPEEKPQNRDMFLYILVVILAVVIAYVTYRNESRLSDYDRKFSEMNKNVKYLEMLKTLKIEVPEMKETISTIQDHVKEANNRFLPLWTKLSETQDKVDLSENKTKTLEIESKKLKSDMVQMRTDSERLSGQSKNVSLKMHELIPQLESAESYLSTLHKKMAETEERVLPSIERQKELTDTVDKLSIKVNNTALSVYGANETLSNITSQMKRNQPMFDDMEKTFKQAQTIKNTIGNMQQYASRTERSILNLHGRMMRTESRFSKLSSNVMTVEDRLTAVDDKHTQLVTRQTELDVNMEKSKNDIINLDDQLTKAKREVEDFKGKLASTKEDMTLRLDDIFVNIAKAESKMSSIKTESEGYSNRINDLENRTNERIDKLYVRTETEEQFTTYLKSIFPGVVSDVETIKGSAYSTWMISVMDLLEIAAITYLFYVLFNGKYQDGYSQSSAGIQSDHHMSPTGTSSSHQRPSSILDQISRKPVLANKICILSFYAETQSLHKSLVTSALMLSRRGKTMQIIPHLVRRHEDILHIPSARYIFIFVDFNERNVILEKPDQDLGDKKVVTVKAAQKLGGDVFVTYVRDKGSANLFPGNLFNINLSAFTTHPVLKPLEINQRCFSVYEHYTNTQREHIAGVLS